MISRAECINKKCKDCSYDPLAAGTWRQQIAVCPSVNCALHPVRPVPKSCGSPGRYDKAAIYALTDELERIDRERSSR